MNSTLNPKPPDPTARYFEQIALANPRFLSIRAGRAIRPDPITFAKAFFEDEQIARTLADDAARQDQRRRRSTPPRTSTRIYGSNVPPHRDRFADIGQKRAALRQPHRSPTADRGRRGAPPD
jgi:hypothetical protein